MWIAISTTELRYLDVNEIKHLDYSPTSHHNARPLGGLKINGELFCHDTHIGEYLFNALRDYFMSVANLKNATLCDAIEKSNKRILNG